MRGRHIPGKFIISACDQVSDLCLWAIRSGEPCLQHISAHSASPRGPSPRFVES